MRLRMPFSFVGVLAMVAGLLVVFGQPAQAYDRDCSDFANQRDAQVFFLDAGGPSSDPHRLDADGDGKACDSLPCPCYTATTDTSTATTTTTRPVVRQRAKVVKVVDGDTVRVRIVGGPRRDVRMIGIDTPEVYGRVECGGPQASRSLKRMLPVGTLVRLVSDPTQAYKDRYDRLLRYVIKASDGRDMNRTQVSKGWAAVYVYNAKPFQRVKGFRAAQAGAKAAPRGIWRLCR